MRPRSRQPNHWIGRRRVLLAVGRAARRGDAGAVLRRLARGHDDAVGVQLGDQKLLLLLDPVLVGELLQQHAGITIKGPGVQRTRALLGNGLLSSEGADHDRVRRLVAPAFSPRRLERYIEIFAGCTQRATANWRDGDVLDLHQVLGTLTLDIVGHTLLGVDLSERSSDIRGALESALQEFGRAPAAGSLIPRRSDPSALPTDAFAAVHAALDAVIDERRRSPSEDRGDVISALLAAQEAGLTDQEIHDNAMTLVMAGHETTANALSWTLHLLGQHPQIEHTLHEELEPLAGRAPRWDELPTLTYTRAVLTEAMRLYPPAWVMGRTMTQPVTLGAWSVPAQTIVAASPLLLHHDPRWYPDPESFDPSRWLDARKESVPRNAYLPFGTGPRSCIGEQFAWAEATTILATIAGTWSARPLAGHDVVPQYAVTLRPGNGLPMRLNHRGTPTRPVE